MNMKEYVNNIKLEITGGILTLEIPDSTLEQIVNRALQEVQRFIDSTELMTVPYASCIDISNTRISSVSRVFRTEGFTGDTTLGGSQSVMDPMYAQTWMAFTNGGTMYNLNDYLLNYLSYSTILQLRNTTSTDMSFKQDHQAGKLYINCSYNTPEYVTIEYVPKFASVEDVKSDYWIDVIQRLSIAQTKIILGRIRSRFKSSSSLWEQDGDTILAEGKDEINALRETLRTNSQIIYPID